MLVGNVPPTAGGGFAGRKRGFYGKEKDGRYADFGAETEKEDGDRYDESRTCESVSDTGIPDWKTHDGERPAAEERLEAGVRKRIRQRIGEISWQRL